MNTKIKMFGDFSVKVDGQYIDVESKACSKVELLFQYFLINNGKEVAPEIIVEILWPENDYTDLRNAISTYVSRLKKFLQGENGIKKDVTDIFILSNKKGNYQMDIKKGCSFDIMEFESISKTIGKSNLKNPLTYLKKTLDIFEGPLLGNITYNNVFNQKRNFYNMIFNQNCNTLLSLLWAQEKYDDIIKYCEMIFKLFPKEEYANNFYLKAMYENEKYSEFIIRYKYYLELIQMDFSHSADLENLYVKARIKTNPSLTNPSLKNDELLSVIAVENDYSLQSVINMLNQLADGLYQSTKTKYSIGYASLQNMTKENEEHYKELVNTIEDSLRNGDFYGCFPPSGVVFVLKNAKIESLEKVSIRVRSKFFEKTNDNVEIDIMSNYDKVQMVT